MQTCKLCRRSEDLKNDGQTNRIQPMTLLRVRTPPFLCPFFIFEKKKLYTDFGIERMGGEGFHPASNADIFSRLKKEKKTQRECLVYRQRREYKEEKLFFFLLFLLYFYNNNVTLHARTSVKLGDKCQCAANTFARSKLKSGTLHRRRAFRPFILQRKAREKELRICQTGIPLIKKGPSEE